MFSNQRIRPWAIAALGSLILACGGGGGDGDDWLYPLWVSTDVLVADIDGDSRADVITLAQLSSSLSQREGRLLVRLQSSPGVFGPAQTYIVGVYPWKMALADIDGDGAAYLVVTDVGSTSSTADRAVWMLRQDIVNRGHFLAPQRLDLMPSNPYDVAIGDVNGDNTPDIVVADSLAPGVGATVLYQDPSRRGTFLAPVLIALPGSAGTVAIGDLNGDGRNDLAFRMYLPPTGYVPSTVLGLVYQLPGGTLGAAVTLSPQTGVNGKLLAMTDYNADGMRDLVEFLTPATIDYKANISTLLQSSPAGSFGLIQTSLADVKGIDGGAVGDLNGDGRPDFASVGFFPLGSPTTFNSSVNVLMQNGSGGFALSASIAMPVASSRVAIGDVDGDSLNDLVVLGGANQVFVLRQSSTAHGSFLAPQILN